MPTVPIVATPGAADANSYVTLDEANAYFAGRLGANAWDDAGAASPEQQSIALVTATMRIDQESYAGLRATTTQALQWPRVGAIDEDGRVVPSDTIPGRVKRGLMELALALLDDDEMLADTGLEGFRSVTVGSISVTTIPRSAGTLPTIVSRELRPFLAASGGQITLVRG